MHIKVERQLHTRLGMLMPGFVYKVAEPHSSKVLDLMKVHRRTEKNKAGLIIEVEEPKEGESAFGNVQAFGPENNPRVAPDTAAAANTEIQVLQSELKEERKGSDKAREEASAAQAAQAEADKIAETFKDKAEKAAAVIAEKEAQIAQLTTELDVQRSRAETAEQALADGYEAQKAAEEPAGKAGKKPASK